MDIDRISAATASRGVATAHCSPDDVDTLEELGYHIEVRNERTDAHGKRLVWITRPGGAAPILSR